MAPPSSTTDFVAGSRDWRFSGKDLGKNGEYTPRVVI